MPHPRLLTAAVALVVSGMALGACGGQTTTNHAARTTTTSSPAQTTTSKAAVSTTTSTTSATGTTCPFSALAITGSSQGATGHIAVTIVFKNIGSSTCTLSGYPGVAGLDSSGNQAVQATRTLNGFVGGVSQGPPPVVQLQPGQSASAIAEGTDVPTGTETSCPSYPSLLVTPPNLRQSKTLPDGLPGCSGIQIHPVVPGTTGRA